MVTTAPWAANDFAELLTGPGVFVAVPDGLIGPKISRGARGAEPFARRADLHAFALGRVILDEAELLTLAVDPGQQRRGLGQACLSVFETEARTRGAARAFLEVAATNTAATALYAGNGWVKDGTRRAYYRTENGQIDAIVMSKSLLTP